MLSVLGPTEMRGRRTRGSTAKSAAADFSSIDRILVDPIGVLYDGVPLRQSRV